MKKYKIQLSAWFRPAFYCGAVLSLFILLLGLFSGDIFNTNLIYEILSITLIVELGGAFVIYVALVINGLRLNITIFSHGIRSYDFMSSPNFLKWDQMDFVHKKSILGFPYFVIESKTREQLWLPIQVQNLSELITTIENNLDWDSEVVKKMQKLNA